MIFCLKYPYGIWNLLAFRSLQKRCMVWSIPMGFETYFDRVFGMTPIGLKYPYGIWNSPLACLFWWLYMFEVSLWDLKLKAKIIKNYAKAFEVSLWDLKLCHGGLHGWYCRLKYPYGIWNSKGKCCWVVQYRFEVSLWDLKLRCNACSVRRDGCLKYPYGIWNGLLGYRWSLLFCLKYPYGIWNSTATTLTSFSSSVWSIPMGFETIRRENGRYIQTGLKYPYGIWNQAELTQDGFYTSLKYPYGIWNVSRSPMLPRHDCLKYPYGIWNGNWKRRDPGVRVWSIPMGFETMLWSAHLWFSPFVWSIPMGFET